MLEASAETNASTLRKLDSASTSVKAITKLVAVNKVTCSRNTKSVFSASGLSQGTRWVPQRQDRDQPGQHGGPGNQQKPVRRE